MQHLQQRQRLTTAMADCTHSLPSLGFKMLFARVRVSGGGLGLGQGHAQKEEKEQRGTTASQAIE